MPIIISAILFLISFLNIYPKILYGGDVEGIFLYPDVFLYKNLFIWSEGNSFGEIFSDFQALPLNLFFKFFSIFLNYKILNYFFYALIFILSFWAIYYFLKKIDKYYFNLKINNFIFYLASGLYIFNLHFLHLNFRGIHSELVCFVLIPFGLGLFIDFINNKKDKYIYLLILPLVMLGMNFGLFLIFCLGLILITILDCFLKKRPIKIFFGFIKFFLMLLILSAFWILPMISFYKYNYYQISENNYIKATTVEKEFEFQKKYHSIKNILKNLNQGYLIENTPYPIIKNLKYDFLYYSSIFFIILGLFICKKAKKEYLFFFVIYLVIVLIYTGANMPLFGPVFEKIITKIPGMIAFRSIHTKFNFLMLIVQATMYFILFANIKYIFDKKRMIAYLAVLFVFILLIMPSTKFVFNLYDSFQKVSIPKDYLTEIEKFKDIAQKNNLKNGFILPQTCLQWTTYANWGFWGYSLFQQATNDIGFHTVATSGLNNNNYKIFKNLIKVYSSKLDIEKLKEKNIDFFIYQKDFKYNFSKHYTFDNQDEEIKKFFQKNNNKIQNIQSNKYFEVYQFKNSYPYKFVGKDIVIKKISPVKYKIYLQNIKDFKEIAFLETYHPEWKLYLKNNPAKNWCGIAQYDDANGITICKNKNEFFDIKDLLYLWKKDKFATEHKIFNDYANSWVISSDAIKSNYPSSYYKINSDGSIDIELILYFRPQAYFYLGLIITLIGISVGIYKITKFNKESN